MRQTTLSSWRRPYQQQPGRDGAGPLASKGPTQATGASANLTVRGRQSRATDQTSQPPTTLKVAQWNAEGLGNKKPELQEFLRKNNIDVICIQETHLKDPRRFFVRGYEPFRQDRKDRHKGGIITLVRNSIPAVETNRSEGQEQEHLTVKLLLPSGDLWITNYYSPSTSSLALHKVKLEASRHLVAGDFNSHSQSWGYEEMDARGEEVEDWMMENNLILINQADDKPTCFSRAWKTTSTPDLAIATEDIHKLTSREVSTQLGGSDHLPVILNISSLGCTERNMQPSWNFKRANWTLFAEKADHHTKDIKCASDLNKNVQKFTDAILQAAKQTIPRGKRRHYLPYWSDTLEHLHSKMDHAREVMEQLPTPENLARHNNAKEAFNQRKKTELQKSWNEKTSSLNMEKDTSKLWKLTKALNEDTRAGHSKTVIEENGTHYTGRKAANILADFYKEESEATLPNARVQEVCKETRKKLKPQNPTAPMTSAFSMAELNAAIKKLKLRKAPGKDGVLNEMIKNLRTTARQKLLLIINQSWSSGKFPDRWREAVIIPIKKKQKNKTKKSSYRPISLLSCLGKVMERMVNTRLLKHLEENHLLSNTQSAYRKNRSTEDQLIYLAQQIENAFQEKKKVLAVFVDLTKAFDKVWKEGLLLKLLDKKVEGNMYRWIQNFLQYRTARVQLDGKISHRITLQQGVPQGGVISPTLFLIFIDDIAEKLTKHISRALHADDFAAWSAAEHLTTASYRMQEALEHVGRWASDWGVEINATKTVATVFSLSPLPESINLKMNGRKLKQEDNPTYLGIRLDKRLTWNPHLKSIENEAVKKLAIMKKLAGTSWGANSSILQKVYVGTVRPTLEYGSSAWATASKTNTSRLNKVQNAGLRLITGGMKTTPIQAMEKLTSLQSLEDRREEKVFIHSEKLMRMPTHPMHTEMRNPTKNRLKRTSFNHLSKSLHRRNEDLLPASPAEMEMLPDFEEPDNHPEDIAIITEVPGIERKDCQAPQVMKVLAQEMIADQYNPSEWTHVFTDGSSERAVKNGGAGVFIRHTNGKVMHRAFPTGKISSNYRAETEALLHAVRIFLGPVSPPQKVVFFTDCRSLLQRLQNSRSEQHMQDIKAALHELSRQSVIALQWVPSHCGIMGNEKADALSKAGSKMEQFSHPVTYREAKTIIHNQFRSQWKRKLGAESDADPIHQLQRHQQTILFRLRTGHCRLLSHLNRLKITHTDQCPCGTGPQTPEHVLLHCPAHAALRHKTWPGGVELQVQLWGTRPDLEKTVGFIMAAGLQV